MVLGHIKSAAIVAIVSSIIQYIGNLWLIHQFGFKINIGTDIFDKALRDWAKIQIKDVSSTLKIVLSTGSSVFIGYLLFKIFLEAKIEARLIR
jgi:hypothetical protein